MRVTDVPAQDGDQLLAPPNAMAIVALERQILHEKIVHLRALREAAEAQKALAATKASALRT
jgi:hypothetical protein